MLNNKSLAKSVETGYVTQLYIKCVYINQDRNQINQVLNKLNFNLHQTAAACHLYVLCIHCMGLVWDTIARSSDTFELKS